MSRAQEAGRLLRAKRLRAGLTQKQAASLAKCAATRVAHAEQGADVPPAHVLRGIAYACELDAYETVELLASFVGARRRPVLSVDGLTPEQVMTLVALVERLRLENGQQGACVACNAGPGGKCAPQCEVVTFGMRTTNATKRHRKGLGATLDSLSITNHKPGKAVHHG